MRFTIIPVAGTTITVAAISVRTTATGRTADTAAITVAAAAEAILGMTATTAGSPP